MKCFDLIQNYVNLYLLKLVKCNNLYLICSNIYKYIIYLYKCIY